MRFPEFKDEWKSSILDTIVEALSTNSLSWDALNKNKGKVKNIHYGLIHKGFETTIISSDNTHIPYINESIDTTKMNFIKSGDLVIVDTSEDKKDVAKAIELKLENDDRIVSGLHTFLLRDKTDEFAFGFKSYHLKCKSSQIQLNRISTGTKVYSINKSNLKEITINYPTKDEQFKIVDLLNKIENKIQLQMKIIEEYKMFKDLYISNILSSNEVYELSIHEAMKRNEFEIVKSSQLKMFDGSRKYLSTSSIDKNGITSVECMVTYLNRPSRASMLPIKNSVWFAKMSNSNKVFVSCDNDENEFILSTGFYGLLPMSNVSSVWLSEIFKSDYFNNQKNRFSEGSSMSAIKDSQLYDINIKLFIENNMQQKHLRYINKLNSKIKIEGLLLEKLEVLKKDLLQKMLI
ncbi:MAG: restriction endonuclease subunit S [bacterium]